MKIKAFKRIIALLLAIFTLFTLVACDKNGNTIETSTQEPAKKEVAFTPDEEYVIVRGEIYSSNEEITDACFYLKMALEKAYGIKVSITTDTALSGTGKEFMIGSTNRKLSQDFFLSLSINDYGYYIASKTAIVIAGATPENTVVAVKKFCEDILTYNGKKVQTANPEMKTLTKFTTNEAYDYSTLLINGILWEDYKLVVSSSADIAGAYEFNKVLGKYTGQALPITLASEMTGEEEAVIRLGAVYRNGKTTSRLNGYITNVYEDTAGKVICVDAVNQSNYQSAIEDLLSRAEQSINGDTVSLDIGNDTTYKVTTTDADGASNKQTAYMHWNLDSETIEEISDGVTYVAQTFYDDEGLPYRVYTLIVDTKINRLDMGTGNDGYACPLLDVNLRQTTQQHMEAAVKNGENVIAGVNADFFNNREHGDYAPWGLAIKDGTLLSQKNPERPRLKGTTGVDRPFFGVDFNGNPLIAMESEYPPDAADISTLNMAVGGAYILAEDGKTIYYPNGMTGVIIYGVIDPHTMVGIREDGTVVLMVVDGRRKDYSNGASLLQCSILMQRFGSDDVMLLDGGGSSNMVLRDPVANTYTTVNKPDDGHLRKMFNSILVVKK